MAKRVTSLHIFILLICSIAVLHVAKYFNQRTHPRDDVSGKQPLLQRLKDGVILQNRSSGTGLYKWPLTEDLQ